MSVHNTKDPIGNRTRDLPACKCEDINLQLEDPSPYLPVKLKLQDPKAKTKLFPHTPRWRIDGAET